jgi:hypothetical protein
MQRMKESSVAFSRALASDSEVSRKAFLLSNRSWQDEITSCKMRADHVH